MNSVWQALAWKEWREHRWIIALLAAFFLFVPSLFALKTPGIIFAAVSSMLLFLIPMISMFLGMSVAAREQSTGTIRFLQALPTTGTRPAAAKLFWAAVAIVAPIAIAMSVAAIWSWVFSSDQMRSPMDVDVFIFLQGTWGAHDWFLTRGLAAGLAGLSLLIWMAAIGVNLADEVRAGAVGFLVIASTWLGLLLLFEGWEYFTELPPPRWFFLLIAAAPGAPGVGDGTNFAATPTGSPFRLWPLALAAMVSHAALIAVYLRRFGRVVPGRAQEMEQSAGRDERTWLAPPRRSPSTAILWKQARESAPLAALGAGVIGIIGALIWLGSRKYEQFVQPTEAIAMVFATWMSVGIMVSIVAGIGAFMDDLRPGLHTFWRSRPINVNQWFMLKYLSGLLLTITILALPMGLVIGYMTIAYGTDASLPGQQNVVEALLSISAGLGGQASVYAAAAGMMVLLRHPIYATVSSMIISGVTVFASMALAEYFDYRPEGAFLCGALAALGLISAVVAWCAVERDWGWKH